MHHIWVCLGLSVRVRQTLNLPATCRQVRTEGLKVAGLGGTCFWGFGRTARSTCGLMILMHELDDLHGLNPGNSLSCLLTSDLATSLSLVREQQHLFIHTCIMYRRGRGPWVVQLARSIILADQRKKERFYIHTLIHVASLSTVICISLSNLCSQRGWG